MAEKLKKEEELCLKYMLAEKANSSEGLSDKLFTVETRNSLLEMGLIYYDARSGLYYLTKNSNNEIVYYPKVIKVYPLMSDLKSSSGGTSRSFRKTFNTASPSYINKLLSELIDSGKIKKLKNTDLIVQKILDQCVPNLSAAMLNKLHIEVSSLMVKKRKALPKKVEYNVLKKIHTNAKIDLELFEDNILDTIPTDIKYNISLTKTKASEVIFKGVEYEVYKEESYKVYVFEVLTQGYDNEQIKSDVKNSVLDMPPHIKAALVAHFIE